MTAAVQDKSTDSHLASTDRAGGMKAERDRFVALAFCWADLLFELDPDYRVVFVAGATQPVLGMSIGQVIGQKLTDLVAEGDKVLTGQLLNVAKAHGRIENVSLRLSGKRGSTPPLMLAGYNMPDMGGHYFLALRTSGVQAAASPGVHAASREMASGLFDGDSFSDIAVQRLKGMRAANDDAKVTLLSLDGLKGLKERIGDEGEERLMHTVGACLRANSVLGDSAARISNERFSLVHKAEMDIADLIGQINTFARQADPEGKGLVVESATVSMEDAEISDEDLAKGLMYTINQFRQTKGTEFTLSNLSTSMSDLVGKAVSEVNGFRAVVADNSFQVAFQPIINVESGVIHHYEALVRFPTMGASDSPYKFITFAEETGLIHDFDIAMARKVVGWLSTKPRNSDKYRVAVNISGNSVGNLAYVNNLHNLLQENPWARGKLMFEITESARMTDLETANNFIQNLRREGFHVCLDDFGAGAASFQYLSALDVDVVKLDGSAIRNSRHAPKGKAFLSALTELCSRLGVETIAEMIDDTGGLEFIRQCGVDYVQGFLFGRPSSNIKDFEPLPNGELFRGRGAVVRPRR
ncbi:MAG: EAL domain-containing protein [Rhodospirillales bacterium]|nr:EAL domain-containing protein [Rhodospirillales bacterium]